MVDQRTAAGYAPLVYPPDTLQYHRVPGPAPVGATRFAGGVSAQQHMGAAQHCVTSSSSAASIQRLETQVTTSHLHVPCVQFYVSYLSFFLLHLLCSL